MKSALAALAFASFLSFPSLAQQDERVDLAQSGQTPQIAAPALACTAESVDPACARSGGFQPNYDIQREFDGYYSKVPGQ